MRSGVPFFVRAALASALLLGGAGAQASKLNPALRVQRGMAASRIGTAAAGAPEPSYRVLLVISAGTTIEDLRASYPRATFRSSAGRVVTATIPDSILASFEGDPRVLRVEAARKLHKTMDVVRSSATTSGGLSLGVTRNSPTVDLATATGKGVIVGVVDTGIDYHHADFRSGGTSRILYLWDQTDRAGPAPNFTALGFSCSTNGGSDDDCTSTEWTQAQLTAGTAREYDNDGHGTHVAGIAAGNGLGGSSPGTYVGMAPQADIIFVKTGFFNDEIIDGVTYIAKRAALLGKPAVVNLSLGGQIDPHDGTSPYDRAIGALAANTPVVVAMGNEGTGITGTAPHAQVPSLASGSSVALALTANAGGRTAEVDLWTGSPTSASNSAYTVSVAINGTTCVTKTDGTGTYVGGVSSPVSCTVGGATYSVYLDNNDSAVGQPGGGTNTANDREIYALVYKASGFATSVPFTITLTCTNGSTCGKLDAFVDPAGEGVNFQTGANYTVPPTLTMGTPATANNVFAVGSYASKKFWTADDGFTYNSASWTNPTLGAGSTFSGWGPTRDGRAKPDVAAPGDVIAATLSSQAALCSSCTFTHNAGSFNQVLADGAHAILAGTSMATPVVTGILATRLQGAPTRTVAQLRTILQGLATQDSAYAGLGSNAQYAFGAGKVVASPQPITPPLQLTAAALGVSSITWSWSSSLLSADAFDLYYGTNSASSIASAVQPPYTQAGLLPNATYSVQIKGEGGGVDGPGSFITAATFANPPASAPAATGFSSSATVTYSACPAFPNVNSCSGYSVQASTAADFSGVVFSSATAARSLTQLTLSGLSPSVGYFVRLGYLNPLSVASYGPSSTFGTGSNLAAPTFSGFDLISTGTVRILWTQGANPSGLTYVAQASTAANFSGSLLSQAGTALNALFSGLPADTSYYFQVQAVGGPFLTVSTPAATLAVAPAAAAPPFTSVSSGSLVAVWKNAGDQPDTLYKADLSTASDFSTGVVSALVRSTSAAFAGLAPNTLYYARAAAISRSGAATQPLALGSTATLVLPPASAAEPFSSVAVDGFSFTFGTSGNPTGTRYLVQVSTDSSFGSVAASSNTASSTATFSGLLSNRLYYAEVEALNATGAATAFTTPVATATLVGLPVALASPIATRTAAVLGFSWSAGLLAPGTRYVAQLSSSPTFAVGVISSNTANTSATFSGLQPNTTYFGTVQALSSYPPAADGSILWTAAAGATLPNPPGAPAAPFPGVYFTSVTVAWSALPLSPSSAAAEGYRAELSTASDFSGPVLASVVDPAFSSATFSGLSYGSRYYARVASLSWENLPNYLVLGSTFTGLPPMSSGTVSGAGLTLNVSQAFPQIASILVAVPGGAFPAGTTVSAVANVGVTLAGARTNESAALTPFAEGVGIDLSAGGLQPLAPVRIAMAYDPAQIPAGQDEKRLQLWRYDLAAGQWTIVPSQADVKAHVLTAYPQHFSIFAPFFTTPSGDMSSVQVFPQPWEAGDSSSQYWASVLTFSSLPAGSRVRLFTLTGELVYDGSATGAGVLTWDGSTRFGRKAASGTYYAAFENGGQRLVRRVVVIR